MHTAVTVHEFIDPNTDQDCTLTGNLEFVTCAYPSVDAALETRFSIVTEIASPMRIELSKQETIETAFTLILMDLSFTSEIETRSRIPSLPSVGPILHPSVRRR